MSISKLYISGVSQAIKNVNDVIAPAFVSKVRVVSPVGIKYMYYHSSGSAHNMTSRQLSPLIWHCPSACMC